jgi:hypothetical protein
VAGLSMAASSQVTAKRLRLNGNLIDLIGGMAGALVDALHGLGAGRLGEAEHHARLPALRRALKAVPPDGSTRPVEP